MVLTPPRARDAPHEGWRSYPSSHARACHDARLLALGMKRHVVLPWRTVGHLRQPGLRRPRADGGCDGGTAIRALPPLHAAQPNWPDRAGRGPHDIPRAVPPAPDVWQTVAGVTIITLLPSGVLPGRLSLRRSPPSGRVEIYPPHAAVDALGVAVIPGADQRYRSGSR